MSKCTKTRVEYGDLGWNFFPGCLHRQQGVCPVKNCWAKDIERRFHGNPDFTPTLRPEFLGAPLSRRKPARILVNFMGDLFGDWVDPNQQVFYEGGYNSLSEIVHFVCRSCPQHAFLFLTKAPWNIKKWGDWPDNCWMGATATSTDAFVRAMDALLKVKAAHFWVSLEPLSEWRIDQYILDADLTAQRIGWIVVGAQSRPNIMPKLEWVRDIVEAADKVGITVFVKEPMASAFGIQRQEYPK